MDLILEQSLRKTVLYCEIMITTEKHGKIKKNFWDTQKLQHKIWFWHYFVIIYVYYKILLKTVITYNIIL